MTEETIQQTVDTTTAPEPASADPVADLSARMDQAIGIEESQPNDGITEDAANAPETGNPSKEAPATEVPADTDSKPVDEDATKDEANDQPNESDTGDDTLVDEILGVDPAEKPTDDIVVLKTRHAEATRYIGELSEKLKAQASTVEAVLASAGRMIVNTKDGPKLAPIEGAEQASVESLGVDLKNVYKSLTAGEQDLFNDDPEKAASLIAERVAKQVAQTLVPAQASKSDIVLTQSEADTVFEEFKSSKFSDGKTLRFPDADNPEVKEMMARAYQANTPAMEKLRDVANKDKDLHHVMLDYLWLKAFRARHAKLSQQAASKRATEEKKQKITKEVRVSSSGASTRTNAQTPQSVVDESARLSGAMDAALTA